MRTRVRCPASVREPRAGPGDLTAPGHAGTHECPAGYTSAGRARGAGHRHQGVARKPRLAWALPWFRRYLALTGPAGPVAASGINGGPTSCEPSYVHP